MFTSTIPSVILVVVVMLGTIVFLSLKDIDMKPSSKHSGYNKIVDIEAFEEKKDGDVNHPADHFCEDMKGKTHELETHCNSFTEQSCKYSSCCVYASIEGTEKCMAGGSDGPTFGRNEDGKKKNIDFYYYKQKCYGDKCNKENK